MNQVSWTSILIGLALFLFGIDYLSLSLQELSSTRLKNLLSKCTSSTFKAILIGCFITCIIQSSSATTALTVSLINANLMTFSQSIGIIMGANIGTTITAFIVGFVLCRSGQIEDDGENDHADQQVEPDASGTVLIRFQIKSHPLWDPHRALRWSRPPA